VLFSAPDMDPASIHAISFRTAPNGVTVFMTGPEAVAQPDTLRLVGIADDGEDVNDLYVRCDWSGATRTSGTGLLACSPPPLDSLLRQVGFEGLVPEIAVEQPFAILARPDMGEAPLSERNARKAI